MKFVKSVEIGSIVRIVAPGSRETEGEARTIPAIVMHQWPDGTLQLYCLHFQGSPLLQNAVPPEMVEVVMSRSEFDLVFTSIHKRLTALEGQVAALGGGKYQQGAHDGGLLEPKFSMADDAH